MTELIYKRPVFIYTEQYNIVSVYLKIQMKCMWYVLVVRILCL